MTTSKEVILCLPNKEGFIETVQRICNHPNVRNVYQSTTTLRSRLTQVNTPINRFHQPGIIYQIPCQCEEVYIRETWEKLIERMQEHKRAVRRSEKNNSSTCTKGNAQHIMGRSNHHFYGAAWDQKKDKRGHAHPINTLHA